MALREIPILRRLAQRGLEGREGGSPDQTGILSASPG
jgi:hypothetical protein